MAEHDTSSDESEDLFQFDNEQHVVRSGAIATGPSHTPAAAPAPAAAHMPAGAKATTAGHGTAAAHSSAAAHTPGAAHATAASHSPAAPRMPVASHATGAAHATVTGKSVEAEASRPNPVAAQLPLVPAVEVARPRAVVGATRTPERPARTGSGLPTRVLLALAIAVNVSLVGVVWRSMSGMNDALQQVTGSIAAGDSAPDRAGLPPEHSVWSELDLSAASSNDGETALLAARREIEHGEYESARARLYSLLSVIDRFDAPLRPNLAARAQVLAADAYREQADAIERAAIAPQNEGRFVEDQH